MLSPQSGRWNGLSSSMKVAEPEACSSTPRSNLLVGRSTAWSSRFGQSLLTMSEVASPADNNNNNNTTSVSFPAGLRRGNFCWQAPTATRKSVRDVRKKNVCETRACSDGASAPACYRLRLGPRGAGAAPSRRRTAAPPCPPRPASGRSPPRPPSPPGSGRRGRSRAG